MFYFLFFFFLNWQVLLHLFRNYKFACLSVAGRPDAPTNCTLINQTTQSLEVECVESFDGGQPQYFLLEVVDVQTGELQSNVSNKFPAFRVTGLPAGRVLRMQVYAANIKGRSDYVHLDGSTLEIAEKQTGRATSNIFSIWNIN